MDSELSSSRYLSPSLSLGTAHLASWRHHVRIDHSKMITFPIYVCDCTVFMAYAYLMYVYFIYLYDLKD